MAEIILIMMGLFGMRQLPQQQPYYQPPVAQQYYNPQTGKYYLYYNGYMYEQNVSQYQGYQGQPPQNLAATYGAPQPSNGQWYPQQPAQTAANPQGYYR